jgi:RES domain-containing protein
MPTAWRITVTRDPARAFSGDGARIRGGRWNSKGTRIVYAADYPAGAILEQLVQVSFFASLPVYQLFAITFPETAVSTVSTATLPVAWRDPSRDPAVQAIGDAWISGAISLVLRVPSAVAPHHSNYLINPAHPAFPSLKIDPPEQYTLDPRLLRRRAR